MKGAPVMRAYGLIAAALVALLALPMPAHSDDKFPIDPKKGDLEAEGKGGMKSDRIPVQKALPARLTVSAVDQITNSSTKLSSTVVTNLGTGRRYKAAAGVYKAKFTLPAGVYRIQVVFFDPALVSVGYLLFKPGDKEKKLLLTSISPPNFRDEKHMTTALNRARQRIQKYCTYRNKEVPQFFFKAVRMEKNALYRLRVYWPVLRDKLFRKLSTRARSHVRAALAEPTLDRRYKALSALAATPVAVSANGEVIQRLKIVIGMMRRHQSRMQRASALYEDAKRMISKSSFIDARAKTITVKASKNFIGNAKDTGIRIKSGACLTIFVDKNAKWSADGNSSSPRQEMTAMGSELFSNSGKFHIGSLVGKFGKTGTAFFIGTRYKRRITGRPPGTLKLMFWGAKRRDPSGSLKVHVHVK